MQRPVVVVGSVNLDIVVPVRAIPAPGETVLGSDVQRFDGGKGANQAVGVARLGYPVRLIARVGDDEAGRALRQALDHRGVDVRAVAATRGVPTGTALIATDARGENSIIVSPGANAHLRPADIARRAALLRSAALVMLQLEVPLETVECAITLAHRAGVPVMLDPAPAPAHPLPASLLRRVAWLTPNETEAARLVRTVHAPGAPMRRARASELAQRLRRRGAASVIVTLGRQGACIAHAGAGAGRGHRISWVPPVPVRALDSTGAGDAFNAGLAVALVRGQPLLEAARYAAAVAALSATRPGAQPSMPTAREVTRFLRAPR